MSTISNQASPNFKAPHLLNAEAENCNSQISSNKNAKLTDLNKTIENLHKASENNEPKKNFSATIIHPSIQGQNDSKKTHADDNFCIKTYLEEQEEYMKKFDERKAKWKTPLRAFLDGAIRGIGFGIVIYASSVGLIFVAKKIMASALIGSLIQKNQHFFRT